MSIGAGKVLKKIEALAKELEEAGIDLVVMAIDREIQTVIAEYYSDTAHYGIVAGEKRPPEPSIN